jgi:hypothetical protein
MSMNPMLNEMIAESRRHERLAVAESMRLGRTAREARPPWWRLLRNSRPGRQPRPVAARPRRTLPSAAADRANPAI